MAVLQVLHLEAAVREGVQKLRQAMDVEAKLRYQVRVTSGAWTHGTATGSFF